MSENLTALMKRDELNKTLGELSNSYKTYQISDEDVKKVLVPEMFKLCVVRGELFGDYNFKSWLTILREDGYNTQQVAEMLKVARSRLKKYGDKLLVLADLITAWNEDLKERDQYPAKLMNWTDFAKMLQVVLKKDADLLNSTAQAVLGIDYMTSEDRAGLRLLLKQKEAEVDLNRFKTDAAEYSRIKEMFREMREFNQVQSEARKLVVDEVVEILGGILLRWNEQLKKEGGLPFMTCYMIEYNELREEQTKLARFLKENTAKLAGK